MESTRGSHIHVSRDFARVLLQECPWEERETRVYVPATHQGDYISRARLEYLPGGPWDRRVKQNVKLSIFHEQSIISGCIIGVPRADRTWCIAEMSPARARAPQTGNTDNLPPTFLSYVRYAVTWLMIIRS